MDGVGANLSLDRVDSSLKTPPRLHLEGCADDQAAVVAPGASEIPWDKRPPDVDDVILADADAIAFCVVDESWCPGTGFS